MTNDHTVISSNLLACSRTTFCCFSRLYLNTQTRTSIFSLQDSLKIFERTRLFRLRDGFFVVLQHLVDIRLCVKTITANRGWYGRLWAEGNKHSKIRPLVQSFLIAFNNDRFQNKSAEKWPFCFVPFTRRCHDVTFDHRRNESRRSLVEQLVNCQRKKIKSDRKTPFIA